MSSGSDFFPATDGNLALHLKNYRDKLPGNGKALYWSDAGIKASQDRCDRIIAALAANEKSRADYKAQVGITNATKKADLSGLRADIRLLKASVGYTEAIGRDLGIVTLTPPQTITSTDKASATAEAHGDTVRIRWKKGNLDGVNVYMRRQGETDWRRLDRDSHSPYDDRSPLAKPGVPEVREYRVIGVIKDQEVGAPSDILSLLFNG
jgi:hypothetical protein